MLPLNANLFRYAHENSLNILCSFCENEIEDEIHFVCLCPLYKEFRKKSIDSHLQNGNSFAHLMQCQEKISSQNLALFVFHACKKLEMHTVTEIDLYNVCILLIVSGDSMWVRRLITGHRAVCDCVGDGGWGGGCMC